MNWIKQNPALAAIAAIALIGTATLLWLAFDAMSATAKSVSTCKSTQGELVRIYGESIYPTPENLAKKKQLVEDLKKESTALRSGLAKRYGTKAGGDPATFGQRVQEKFNEAKATLDAANVRPPENFFLGMDNFRKTVAANPEAVRDLDYQLSAISALVKFAAASQLSSIDKFTRSPVVGESGGPDKSLLQQPLRRYGLEIQCTGTEDSIRAFNNAIAASSDHFFAFRAIRIMNEAQVAPSKEEVRKQVESTPNPAAAALGSLFGELSGASGTAAATGAAQLSDSERLAAAAAQPEEGAAEQKYVFPTPGQKDAFQFLGSEKVKAVIRLDLVIFEPVAQAPAADKDKEEQ